MEAGKIGINEIFNGARKLEIPFYQRAYVWKEEQWERLLDDLAFVSKTKRPYFIGSIILKKADLNTWDVASDKKIVVDGQQRLTTLMLFFKALCLKTNSIDKFDRQYRLEDNSMALSLGLSDDDAFQKVMKYNEISLMDESKATSNIILAFKYFLSHINTEDYNRTYIHQNLQFVCIDLKEGDDEQQVFDTINSLGVRLTTAELLKNYFYSREDVNQYRENWVEIFEKDADIRTYWNQEFEAGRITRSLIDVFFDAYFQFFIQNSKYKVSAEDKIVYSRQDHLAQSYQDFIKNYCNGNKQEVLSSMADYAKKFKEIFDPTCIDRHMSKDQGMDRMNVIIFGLKTSTLIPYILYAAQNVSDENEFNRMLGILEMFIMRRMVVKESTKNYNNLFTSLILNNVINAKSLIDALNKQKDLSASIPSDDELLEGFKSSKLINLQAKGVIYFIEAGIRTDKNSTALLGFSQYSLEHLMPKKWRNHWAALATEELSQTRDSKLLTLGNLAVITQSLNASVRDSDWTTKKVGKKDNPGLNSCAAGLLTMENVLSENDWSENNIDDRAIWLCEQAKKIWII